MRAPPSPVRAPTNAGAAQDPEPTLALVLLSSRGAMHLLSSPLGKQCNQHADGQRGEGLSVCNRC